ncbi:MAG: TonB-dependent receptor [Deltaproteobacteria bacterium]|nr:MAG: TonB-dependent receptor [Deltaproteobacteria bacterium]
MLLRKISQAAALFILFIGSVALAQATPPPPTTEAPVTTETPAPPTPTSAPPTPAERPALQEEVVVTGSRIRRKDLTTPAPVTVVSRQQFEASGRMTIGDFLQTMPEQGNAPNFQVNTGGINYGADASTRINLRSLGVQRTLVLINGRRVVPGGLGADSSVDLNTIPTEAVERIEVLKDGASAIYGSDAIAGVVNIITRRNYNGTDLGAQYVISGHGDAQTFDAHITSGHSDETYSALFSVRYMNQGDSWLRDRSWSLQALDNDYTGGGSSPSGSSRTPQGTLRIPEDPNKAGSPLCNGNALCNAMVKDGWKPTKRWIRDPAGPYCGPNCLGQTECFRIFNTPAAANNNTGNDFYNFAAENYLTIPSTTVQAFSNGDVKFPVARGYYEASYTQRSATQNAAPMPLNPADYGNIQVSKDSLYNPFGADLNYLGRRLVEFGHRTYSEDLGTFRVVTGLDGALPPVFGPLQGWFWDASMNYGRTTGTFTTGGSFRNSRVANAVGPSMLNAKGQPVCVTKAGDLSTIIPDCVPLNLTGGPGSIDSTQFNYLAFTGTSRAFDELFTLGANFGGDLFKLAADRPTSLAVGYEFRRQSGSQIADPIVEAGDSADFNFKSTSGHFYANEVYAELSLPILANIRGAESLEASAAVRYVNYSTFGGNTSYKFGGRWTPILDFTVRGTYSTAFRAPSISELYLGGNETDPAATDPCADLSTVSAAIAAQCKATGVKGSGSGDTGLQELTRQSGNPGLKAETAKAWSAGVVIQPQMVRGLSVTVDYFDIAIDNAIGTYGAPYILQGCYGGFDQQFCGLIFRNNFGTIQYLNDFYTNTGKKSTAGIDFAIKYFVPTPAGRFAFGFEGNWLAYFDSQVTGFPTVHGKGNFDLGAMPQFKSNLGVEWAMDRAVAGAVARYVSSFDECSNAADPTTAQGGLCNLVDGTTNPFRRRVEAYYQVDIHAGYSIPSKLGTTSFFAGVNNLFDKAAPYIYSAPLANSDPLTYDFLGRYVYGRIQHRF